LQKQSLKETLIVFILLSAGAGLLTVIQEPFNFRFLAWFAYVPLIILALRDNKIFRLLIISYIIGLAYWLGNLYYLIPVTVWGWVAFCAYTALLFPLFIYVLRTLHSKYNIPLFLICAILITGAERLQGFLLGGFAWRMLAHSQYENIRLIQIADIFGAGGVTFLIAMVNGQIAEIINEIINRKKNKISPSGVKLYAYSVIVVFAVITCLVYGTWRIEQSRQTVKSGPEVAAVQSNIPQSVKKSFSAEREILNQLLQHSREVQKSDSLLVIWPETMVQAVMNREILSLISDSHMYSEFDKILKSHAKGNFYLLAGAMGGTPEIKNNGEIELKEKYNSAYLYTPAGKKYHKRYDKIHLVPFGEYIPFRKSCKPIYNFLMSFSPYDYDYSLNPGDEYTIFNITDANGQNYNFGVMICYEDTVPEIASRFTLDNQGNKQADWLVNISNDGWFTKFDNGETIPSAELNQHTVICAFRAVENRVSIVRSVNTGISCVIDPLGRIKNGYENGNLPRNPFKRRGIAGWFSNNLPIDKRVTVFSRYGRWLDNSAAVILTAGFIWSLLLKIKRRRTQQTPAQR
jgi:apolipoprotein N-acyltransferase